jgi:hypothetical protein
VEVEKVESPGDLSRRMDQGKSSHVSSAGNQVTSHGIADRNNTTTKAPHTEINPKHALNKSDRKTRVPFNKQETKGPHSNAQLTGYQELQMKMTM